VLHQCTLFKLLLVFFALLLLNLQLFGGAIRFKATSFSVLVLNAKGGEIKAKATGTNCYLCISKDIMF
jgi:hypothetical protein